MIPTKMSRAVQLMKRFNYEKFSGPVLSCLDLMRFNAIRFLLMGLFEVKGIVVHVNNPTTTREN